MKPKTQDNLAWLRAYSAEFDRRLAAATRQEQDAVMQHPEGPECRAISLAAFEHANSVTAPVHQTIPEDRMFEEVAP